MTVNHLDLFSGIGGFSLAAQRVWGNEHNIIAFCENDKFCQKVLKKHWADVPIIEKIERLNGKKITKTIDLLTGGWPCQPFSVAGKRKGREDDRYLWHEMGRIIQETKPTWILGENVAGIINMELDNVLSDLEGEGYETQTFIIPACAVDARHRRDRIWVVAHTKQYRRRTGEDVSNTKKCKGHEYEADRGHGSTKIQEIPGNGNSVSRRWARWPTEPNVGRVAHGIPSRVDRLKSLGNAIVPQVAEVIMSYIKEAEQVNI